MMIQQYKISLSRLYFQLQKNIQTTFGRPLCVLRYKKFTKIIIKLILIIGKKNIIINKMPKRLIRFNLRRSQDKKDFFLKDPKADFMVILQKKIFPLHKQFLIQSQFFAQLIKENKNSVTINNNINAEYFEKVLGCFYGIEAAFQRHNIFDHILNILSMLRVRQLEDQLKADMRNNFGEYGLFGLFYLSRKFNLADIQSKCIKQLIDEQFEQINYNKYDLFQLSPQLFTFILKQHEKLKAKRSISGHDKKHIRSVCQEYCKTNSAKINIQQILQYGSKYLKQSYQCSDQQKDVPKTRKRNATWNDKKDSQSQKQPKMSKAETETQLRSQNKLNSFQLKSDQVMKIRMINFKMKQKNNLLAEEIKQVRSNIDNKNQNQQFSYGVEDLDKKLREFEQKSKNAHKIMEQLKKKMQKINNQQELQKSDEDQNTTNQINVQKSSLKVNKSSVLQSSSKVLSEMAVLQKSQAIDSDASDF